MKEDVFLFRFKPAWELCFPEVFTTGKRCSHKVFNAFGNFNAFKTCTAVEGVVSDLFMRKNAIKQTMLEKEKLAKLKLQEEERLRQRFMQNQKSIKIIHTFKSRNFHKGYFGTFCSVNFTKDILEDI